MIFIFYFCFALFCVQATLDWNYRITWKLRVWFSIDRSICGWLFVCFVRFAMEKKWSRECVWFKVDLVRLILQSGFWSSLRYWLWIVPMCQDLAMLRYINRNSERSTTNYRITINAIFHSLLVRPQRYNLTWMIDGIWLLNVVRAVTYDFINWIRSDWKFHDFKYEKKKKIDKAVTFQPINSKNLI